MRTRKEEKAVKPSPPLSLLFYSRIRTIWIPSSGKHLDSSISFAEPSRKLWHSQSRSALCSDEHLGADAKRKPYSHDKITFEPVRDFTKHAVPLVCVKQKGAHNQKTTFLPQISNDIRRVSQARLANQLGRDRVNHSYRIKRWKNSFHAVFASVISLCSTRRYLFTLTSYSGRLARLKERLPPLYPTQATFSLVSKLPRSPVKDKRIQNGSGYAVPSQSAVQAIPQLKRRNQPIFLFSILLPFLYNLYPS